MSTPQMVAARASDGLAVASILGQAFRTDPVFCHVMGLGDATAATTAFFDWSFRYIFAPLGLSDMAMDGDQNAVATAVWSGPGHSNDPPLRSLPGMCWSLLRATGPRALVRFAKLGVIVDRHHPREPHHYLHAIGVRPDQQGRGLGGRLLAHGLQRVDDAGMPAYLENSNPRNTPLYRRHGFEIVAEAETPAGGPPMWFMWRKPR